MNNFNFMSAENKARCASTPELLAEQIGLRGGLAAADESDRNGCNADLAGGLGGFLRDELSVIRAELNVRTEPDRCSECGQHV